MKVYTDSDIERSLANLGISPGDCVFMHSSLFPLGLHEAGKEAAPAIARTLLRCLRNGTLAVPAFTFSFCRGAPFDRQRSPAEGMGVLAECIRNLPGALRSAHPMQSVAAIGRDAHAITLPDTLSAFAEAGPFAVMLQKNCKVLLLGAGMKAVSAVHYAEERLQAPYRFWKRFAGPYRDGGSRQTREYAMYVRDLQLDPELDLNLVGARLAERGQLGATPLGSGRAQAFFMRDFVRAATDILTNDPLGLFDASSKERYLGAVTKGLAPAARQSAQSS